MIAPMASYLDQVPFSGIIRIRDMMYTVDRPFRLDQGDVSFDAPESVKAALLQGVHDNRTHYVQTTGIPPLLDHLVTKMRDRNGLPIGGPGEVMVTSGGIHGVYVVCQGLLEPGDEVLVPNPEWPPAQGSIACAHAVALLPVNGIPRYSSSAWMVPFSPAPPWSPMNTTSTLDVSTPSRSLTNPARAQANPDGIVFYKIWNGRSSPKMPTFSEEISKEQAWTIVACVQTLRAK
jgi:hypothetical protein